MGKQTKRAELIDAYIAGTGAVAIVAVEGIWRAVPWADRNGTSVVAVLKNASHAELVLSMAGAGSTPIAIDQAAQMVGAKTCDIELTIGAAAADIDQLEANVKAWGASGGLSRMNAAYKRHRALCIATGEPSPSYSDYLHKFKIKIAALMGNNIAAGVEKFDGVFALTPDPLPSISRRDHEGGSEQSRSLDRHREPSTF